MINQYNCGYLEEGRGVEKSPISTQTDDQVNAVRDIIITCRWTKALLYSTEFVFIWKDAFMQECKNQKSENISVSERPGGRKCSKVPPLGSSGQLSSIFRKEQTFSTCLVVCLKVKTGKSERNGSREQCPLSRSSYVINKKEINATFGNNSNWTNLDIQQTDGNNIRPQKTIVKVFLSYYSALNSSLAAAEKLILKYKRGHTGYLSSQSPTLFFLFEILNFWQHSIQL